MLLARPRRSLRTARRYNKRRVEAWKIIATPSSSVTSMAWSSHGASWSGLLALAELDHLGQIRDGQSSARRARRGVSRPDGAQSLRGGGSPATRSWTSLRMTSPSVAPAAELCTPSPRRRSCIFGRRGIVPRCRRGVFSCTSACRRVARGRAVWRRCRTSFCADRMRRVVGQWGSAAGAVCEDHLTILSRTSACNNGSRYASPSVL